MEEELEDKIERGNRNHDRRKEDEMTQPEEEHTHSFPVVNPGKDFGDCVCGRKWLEELADKSPQ